MDIAAKFEFGNFIIEMVECPSLALPRGHKKALIDECIPVARSAFKNPGLEASDIELHVLKVSTTFFVRDANRALVGFASSVRKLVLGREFVYLEATALQKVEGTASREGSGLYTPLIALRLLWGGSRSSSTPLVTTRTQNPIVFKTMVDKFRLYPQPNEPTPDHLKDLAQMFAAVVQEEHSDWKSVYGLNFDRDNLVVRRAYGRTDKDEREEGMCMHGRIEDIPILNRDPGDPKKDAFIRGHLDHKNGDAFLMIGEFDEALTEAALRKSASENEVPSTQVDKLLCAFRSER